MDRDLKPVQQEVSRILWEDWDPLNMKMWDDAPEDEYDAYVYPVIGIMHEGGGAKEVAKYLCFVETSQMGHTHVAIKCIDVADSCLTAYRKHYP